jgi:hypothetical protein
MLKAFEVSEIALTKVISQKEFTDLLNNSPFSRGVRGDKAVFWFPKISSVASNHNSAKIVIVMYVSIFPRLFSLPGAIL